MSLIHLAYRNLISKPMSLIFNVLLLVLSVSLVTFILQLSQQINGQLEKNIAPVDMVIGAKGSPLQLVLSSVLHIDSPTGNIPLGEVQKIQKHPFIKSAIPLCYGDNHQGYRIVGSKTSFIAAYQGELESGKIFQKSFEVVAGSNVAQKLNLQMGSTFYSSHGLIASADVHKEHQFRVVGILKPTATVLDKLLITPMESVWETHHHTEAEPDKTASHPSHHNSHSNEEHPDHHQDESHEEDAHEHETEDHPDSEESEMDLEITALLVKFKNPVGLVQLPRFINEKTNMQAALPRLEIQRLEGFLGVGVKTVNSIALAVLLVSGLSILLSLARAIRERRQELALLRTYGLSTQKLLYMILLEGLFLAVLGYVLGWIIGRAAIGIASSQLESTFGYGLKVTGPEIMDFKLLGATLLIALIATMLASTSIFKLNISKILSDD